MRVKLGTELVRVDSLLRSRRVMVLRLRESGLRSEYASEHPGSRKDAEQGPQTSFLVGVQGMTSFFVRVQGRRRAVVWRSARRLIEVVRNYTSWLSGHSNDLRY